MRYLGSLAQIGGERREVDPIAMVKRHYCVRIRRGDSDLYCVWGGQPSGESFDRQGGAREYLDVPAMRSGLDA